MISSSTGSNGTAFSLIELLIVIAVIALLVALMTVALPSLLGARGLGRAVDNTYGLLELARTEALSRRTYVYVAFQNTSALGGSQVQVGAVASLDGTPSTTADNLRPLGRALSLRDAQWILNAAPQAVSGKVPNFAPPVADMPKFRVGNVNFPDPQTAQPLKGVIFSPSGEMLQENTRNTFLPHVDIAFAQTRGLTPSTTDGAVIRIFGSSGKIQIIRP